MQLIKSRSDKTRLGIRFETKKRKDYVFTDAQVHILSGSIGAFMLSREIDKKVIARENTLFCHACVWCCR